MPLTVIIGPPCSGKSTYLNTHAQPGDIKIDFDALAVALGSPVRQGHDRHVQAVTIAARRAAIDAALRTAERGATVWIVDTQPSTQRMQAYRAAGAEIIQLNADSAELHKRAARERPRLWHALIDRWQPPSVNPPNRSRDW